MPSPELFEPQPQPSHDARFLREELQDMREYRTAGTPGAELSAINLDELPETDLKLFDRIELAKIDDASNRELEKMIRIHFAGVNREREPSRHQFEAFLRNYLFNKWIIWHEEQRRATLH